MAAGEEVDAIRTDAIRMRGCEDARIGQQAKGWMRSGGCDQEDDHQHLYIEYRTSTAAAF
jgi:hypothetical protein